MAALTLLPVLGRRRGYLRLYMPGYWWIAGVCGTFSLVLSLLRAGLVLGNLELRHLPNTSWRNSTTSIYVEQR